MNSSTFLLLSAATLLFLLPLISAFNPAATPLPSNAPDFIRTSCNATLYPDVCYASLSRYAKKVHNDPAKLAAYALSVSLSNARRMVAYVANLARRQTSSKSGGASAAQPDTGTAAALRDCYSTFGDAVDQMQRSIKEMKYLGTGDRLRFQMSNVQTWMSAALTNEETCTDGFQEAADGPMKVDVCDRALKVKKFTSNGLALVNSYVRQEVGGFK